MWSSQIRKSVVVVVLVKSRAYERVVESRSRVVLGRSRALEVGSSSRSRAVESDDEKHSHIIVQSVWCAGLHGHHASCGAEDLLTRNSHTHGAMSPNPLCA